LAPPAQILIVEDKDSLRTMLRHALERQGHGVLEATNQPEAVRVLLQHQPALVEMASACCARPRNSIWTFRSS
jgi:CheY-like chemotaxis protein